MAKDALKGFFDASEESARGMADLWAGKGFMLMDFSCDPDLDPDVYFHRRGFCIEKDTNPDAMMCCPDKSGAGCFIIPPDASNTDGIHEEILAKLCTGQLPRDILPWLEGVHPKGQLKTVYYLDKWCKANPGKLEIPGSILPTEQDIQRRLVAALNHYWNRNLSVPSWQGATLFKMWQWLTPLAVESRVFPILGSLLSTTVRKTRRSDDLTLLNLARAVSLTVPEVSGRLRDAYGFIPREFLLEPGTWTVYHTLDREFGEKTVHGRWWYYLGYPILRAYDRLINA